MNHGENLGWENHTHLPHRRMQGPSSHSLCLSLDIIDANPLLNQHPSTSPITCHWPPINHSFAGIIARGWLQRLVCIIHDVLPVSAPPHHRRRPDFSTLTPFFPARVFNHWLLLLDLYVFEMMKMCLSNMIFQNLLGLLFENISGSTVMFLWVSINAMCHFQFFLNPL